MLKKIIVGVFLALPMLAAAETGEIMPDAPVVLTDFPIVLTDAQQGMGPGPGTPASAGSSCPYTDNFPGAGVPFIASWTAVASFASGSGVLMQNSGVAQTNGGFKIAADIVTGGTCTFGANQFAQATFVAAGAGDSIAVLARMNSSGNGYGLGSGGQLFKYTAGSGTFLIAGCGSATAGTVMRVTVSGSTITGNYNGTTCATTTDSTYTTGLPGLLINNGSSSLATATQASTFSSN